MYKVKLTTPQIFSEKKLKARYLARLHRVSCFQKGALHKQSTAPTHKNQASVNINATYFSTNKSSPLTCRGSAVLPYDTKTQNHFVERRESIEIESQ